MQLYLNGRMNGPKENNWERKETGIICLHIEERGQRKGWGGMGCGSRCTKTMLQTYEFGCGVRELINNLHDKL